MSKARSNKSNDQQINNIITEINNLKAKEEEIMSRVKKYEESLKEILSKSEEILSSNFAAETVEPLLERNGEKTKSLMKETTEKLGEYFGMLIASVDKKVENLKQDFLKLERAQHQHQEVPRIEEHNVEEDEKRHCNSEHGCSTFDDNAIDTLKKLVDEKKLSEDDYFRRTILISKMQYKCDNEDSYYKKCLRVCKRYGLEYLFDSCTKFYVTEKGDIRLTFSTRRECVAMLLQAKRSLKTDRCFKISVEIMCPRSELE